MSDFSRHRVHDTIVFFGSSRLREDGPLGHYLAEARELDRPMLILLYGSDYWNEILNFRAPVRHGMISPEDMDLFRFVDDTTEALKVPQAVLITEMEAVTPAFAKSTTMKSRHEEPDVLTE